ncbi:carboxypeptidase-like regulatory domain-containing protein [Aureibaculum sp. 2210JD6-5]|uniref:carboxypeptidase-like regulatory domain-containing protein n=1 Tax=Aureibaculum sp. 2210JD6-5 TaxID=3103957 RepID=UPI002AAD3514|nr:carboxypeptidase-like regulatory domain-containing protein [Aureibaculum sp. 2210JD6-5]MDY7395079.1 carboxypeptidase-like regulatory domain-containing protein [Aureibaculum sp. 2210JD6-5]
MKKLLFTLLFISSLIITAQEIAIKGIVSAESYPLPGANVTIKGSSIGTQTDFDGNYEIKAKIGDTLTFSFIGYQTKEIMISEEKDLHIELTIDVDLEVHTFHCYTLSTTISPYYTHGMKYNHSGIHLEINNLYQLSQNLSFNLSYQSNFTSNTIFQFESTFNNLFYIGGNYNATFEYRNYTIEELNFNLKDYKIILDSYYKTIFNRFTKFYFGLGISNFYEENNFGIEGGFQQYLFSNLSIYSKTTYWSKYWEFKNGVRFNFKRIELFAEHHKINNYHDYILGIGYKFYF